MEQPDSPEAALQSPIQAPPVPQDYDEREPMFIQPHDPDYVTEPIYPEYISLEDEHVLPAEEQQLPPVVSPTAESPEYVAESDPEEDPEEYEDDETEDGSVDYPMDGGYNGDDVDDESSGDDVDDEDEEEEEHFASADTTIFIPTDELAAISLPPKADVERLLAMPTPPPSPLASLSPPSAGERLARHTAPSTCPSPPPALSDAVTAALPSPPLPPPLYIPPPVDRRNDIPKTEMPPRKRLCLSTLGSRYEIEESSTARPIRDPAETVPEIAPMTVGERVDLLIEDRIAHQETILIVEEEAYATREAWAHSIGLSQAVYSELQTHWEQVDSLSVGDMRREIADMQVEILALREHPRRARQPGEDARVPDHQDAPRDADIHI
nr:hypothetical protein [Tanacetum cinerariifolium]